MVDSSIRATGWSRSRVRAAWASTASGSVRSALVAAAGLVLAA
ncbi:hypothetical protein [Streptomyces microflavus]